MRFAGILALALALLVGAGAASGCTASWTCGRLARRVCQQTGVSCPPLEQALGRRSAASCRRGAEALDRAKRFPPELQPPLAQGVAARLLGLHRELELVEKARAKVASLLVAASANRSTEDEEAVLLELGPLVCVVAVPAYESATGGKDALRRVMARLGRRDLGESVEPWRQQCYDIVAERAPGLALIGLKP